MKQYIQNSEVIMIKPVAPAFEGEDQIPDDVKKFDEDDILDAEVIQESCVTEELNVQKIQNRLNLVQCQTDFITRLENNSKLYIVVGKSEATSDIWLYLFEILNDESVPVFTMEYYIGDSSMNLQTARTEATKIANRYAEYRNQGLTINDSATKIGMEVHSNLFENRQILESKSEVLGKKLASEIPAGQRVRYRGKAWIVAGHEGLNDDAILNCIDGNDSAKVKGNKTLTMISENYVLPNHGILMTNENLDDEIARWELINSTDFWKKFREDWANSDVYNYANELIVDYAMQPDKLKEKLRNLLTNYDMLEDYEELLNSAVFEDDERLEQILKITNSNFWEKFSEDWADSDVYYQVHDLIMQYATQPKELKEKLCELLNEQGLLDNYKSFLDNPIFEYKNKGTYLPNGEEVEDLYYIQKGDLIIVNHRDYGKIECTVSRVDADKNKVYFHSKEKGIMGVCGFDKIHGIQLVDENKKRINENAFTEMDWSELNNLIKKHVDLGNIERCMNNSQITGSSKDKIEYALYCPNNDCLDAFLTEYNFLKYGKLLDVVYISTDTVILRSHLPYEGICEQLEKIPASDVKQYQKIKHKNATWIVVGHEGIDDDIIINNLDSGETDRISGKKKVQLIVECQNTAVVGIYDNFADCGYYNLIATQEGDNFYDVYLNIGYDADNLIPRKMIDMTISQWNEVKTILDNSKTDEEAFEKLYSLGLIII